VIRFFIKIKIEVALVWELVSDNSKSKHGCGKKFGSRRIRRGKTKIQSPDTPWKTPVRKEQKNSFK